MNNSGIYIMVQWNKRAAGHVYTKENTLSWSKRVRESSLDEMFEAEEEYRINKKINDRVYNKAQ